MLGSLPCCWAGSPRPPLLTRPLGLLSSKAISQRRAQAQRGGEQDPLLFTPVPFILSLDPAQGPSFLSILEQVHVSASASQGMLG